MGEVARIEKERGVDGGVVTSCEGNGQPKSASQGGNLENKQSDLSLLPPSNFLLTEHKGKPKVP